MQAEQGHILVVDDEKVNCNVLVSLLDQYKVIVAKNGEQALQRASSNPPDLILLDVVMPGMSGHEVCQRLKMDERTQHIPVIFITVQSTIEEEAAGLKLGAVDYISKPFSPAIVQARVANHIELKKQRDLLESLNLTDSLTSIANRRKFDQFFAQQWKTASRTQSPLSLLMIDIDHFKEYNDHYGHCAGDECLSRVAQSLAVQTDREVDLVSRYGGEEFAVVLPFTNQEGASHIAHKMLTAIRALEVPHKMSSVADIVTISIGLATSQVGLASRPDELIQHADTALYQAKKTGRNKLSIYS